MTAPGCWWTAVVVLVLAVLGGLAVWGGGRDAAADSRSVLDLTPVAPALVLRPIEVALSEPGERYRADVVDLNGLQGRSLAVAIADAQNLPAGLRVYVEGERYVVIVAGGSLSPGEHLFSYQIEDQRSREKGSARVAVTFRPVITAAPDRARVRGGGHPQVIEVLANDRVPGGLGAVVRLVEAPGRGTAEVLPDGSIRYTTPASGPATDRLAYGVFGGQPESELARAEVVIDIEPRRLGCPRDPGGLGPFVLIRPGRYQVPAAKPDRAVPVPDLGIAEGQVEEGLCMQLGLVKPALFEQFLETLTADERDRIHKDWDAVRDPYREQDWGLTYVDWDTGKRFVRWLSEKSGAALRLPTRAEWLSAYAGLASALGGGVSAAASGDGRQAELRSDLYYALNKVGLRVWSEDGCPSGAFVIGRLDNGHDAGWMLCAPKDLPRVGVGFKLVTTPIPLGEEQ